MNPEIAKKQAQLAAAAIVQKGLPSQIIKAAEECSELAAELLHLVRGRPGAALKVAEEIADVEIMLAQMRWVVPVSSIERFRVEKLARLEQRIFEAAEEELVERPA